MTEQKLENNFRNILKTTKLWWVKLYHVMGRYTSTPGDFIILADNYNYLIECKECKGNTFVLSRYTQRRELEKFHSYSRHIAYLLLYFVKNDIYYFIDYDKMEQIMKEINKKSININDFNMYETQLTKQDLIDIIQTME